MPFIELTDQAQLDNPLLAPFGSLTDAELRDPHQLVGLARRLDKQANPERLNAGLFIAESCNVATRALEAGLVPFSLIAEARWASEAEQLMDRAQNAGYPLPAFVGPRALVQQATGIREPRGPLTAFFRPAPLTVAQVARGARRLAVLEEVTNATNVGALFRSAAALGIDGVLISPGCHDPLYRRAARVSMGTVLQVPWARVADDAWPGETLNTLQSLGFLTCALALTDASLPLQDARLQGHERLALVLGTEGDGLASGTIAACDFTVRIPMDHGVDSLNVAAAGAVAFWELRTGHRE